METGPAAGFPMAHFPKAGAVCPTGCLVHPFSGPSRGGCGGRPATKPSSWDIAPDGRTTSCGFRGTHSGVRLGRRAPGPAPVSCPCCSSFLWHTPPGT